MVIDGSRPIRRIGVLTCGGDCPGLNAVVRALTIAASVRGVEVVGISDGFLGLIEGRSRRLGPADVAEILALGGTILGASSKSDPFRFATGRDPAGRPVIADVADRVEATVDKLGLDGMVVIGGDGTMSIAARLAERLGAAGVPIIGVPKTIDNDLCGTDLSFGFLSAVSVATEALDRVRTTAQAHHRVFAVEVMGRNSGWIALHAGVASGADAILLPEVPFEFDGLERAVRGRFAEGARAAIICVAEGARPRGGEQVVARRDAASPDPVRLGGVAKFVADEIEGRTGFESRYVVLGHTQRGGAPVAEDRVLATLLGQRAIDLLLRGGRGRMVGVRGAAGMNGGMLTDVDLSVPASGQRTVPVSPGEEHPLLAAARAVGTFVGDH